MDNLLKYQKDLLEADRLFRHRIGFGAGYYFAQTEVGLYCPICMTDAMGRVLEIYLTNQTEGHKTRSAVEKAIKGIKGMACRYSSPKKT